MLHTKSFQMRVLCLTMLPDGGALTPALKRLGYTPYSLKTSFQQGHASTHPVEWAQLLEGKKKFDKSVFNQYDCFVGPPATMFYDAILKDCPSYTKVILVEEEDKEGWANQYDAYIENLLKATKRSQKNKISKSFNAMLASMVVSGETGATPAPSSTSSSHQLKKALEKAKESKDKQAASTEEGADLKNPRAIALSRFEESVKMSIPPSRLLVYHHGEGWEPLCEFLEKTVPTDPFPPYEDGLRVLGGLQERIERAVVFYRCFLVLIVIFVLVKARPYLSGITAFISDFVQDLRVAMGKDDDARVLKERKSKAEHFDDKWTRLGGTVTRTTEGVK